jgi:RNA polymerase sigma factor (sigma-70 family)
MGENVTDASLIAASVRESERFAAVFERHFSSIHGYLQRRLGSDLADELAAETFVVAFRARGKYDHAHASARPWLFGIAANLARHQRRTERRRLLAYRRSVNNIVGEGNDAIDARLDAQANRPELARALASLAEGDRDALLLYAWAELSYEEIGEALAIPVGTVRSRISRARRQVRELLAFSGQVQGEEARGMPHG